MRGAITPGANSAQATNICNALIATNAGKIGTDFESEDAGGSIRFYGRGA